MGFPCVLDTTGCEGWPPLSGHLLHVSGILTSVSSVCRTVRCCWGVLRGKDHQNLGKIRLRRAVNRDRGSFWTVQLRDSGTS